MEKEDILLGMEMGRLEIEPIKFNLSRSNDNPFFLHKRSLINTTTSSKESKCTCSSQRRGKQSGISKKKSYKVLKEPVLKLLKTYNNNNTLLEVDSSKSTDTTTCDPLNLCTLVDNCNQLTISSSSNEQALVAVDVISENRWWKTNVNCQESRDQRQQTSASGSCSQQALNPPCDVTIDELASYFETLVHIPKKMSSMAEMMYI